MTVLEQLRKTIEDGHPWETEKLVREALKQHIPAGRIVWSRYPADLSGSILSVRDRTVLKRIERPCSYPPAGIGCVYDIGGYSFYRRGARHPGKLQLRACVPGRCKY